MSTCFIVVSRLFNMVLLKQCCKVRFWRCRSYHVLFHFLYPRFLLTHVLTICSDFSYFLFSLPITYLLRVAVWLSISLCPFVFIQFLASHCRHFHFRYFRYSIVDHFHMAPYGFSRTFWLPISLWFIRSKIVSISPVTEVKGHPLSLFSSFKNLASVLFLPSHQNVVYLASFST